MTLLNTSYNDQDAWNELQLENKRLVEVDLNEVENVIQLALRTPKISAHIDKLRHLKVFFKDATDFYRENVPDALPELVWFWDQYRSAILQRYTNITPLELQSADRIVKDIFERFLQEIDEKNKSYAQDAYPLVYGGEGGLKGYFTFPPGWSRPFAIINLPHVAFDNVWQWLALPHEIGHDLYASVSGLAEELENKLDEEMRKAVRTNKINIPDINISMISLSGDEFLGLLWRSWANEAQADIIGLLNCGGAACVSLQQIIGFSHFDLWNIRRGQDNQLVHEPEPHPTSYVRNIFNIEALKMIDDGNHVDLAREIDNRFNSLKNQNISKIVWIWGNAIFAEVDVAEMSKSAKIAAEVILNHKFSALGNRSYSDIVTFLKNDQTIVNDIVPKLLEGNPTFTDIAGYKPRHALAATVLAFERDNKKIDIINRTFKHFV